MKEITALKDNSKENSKDKNAAKNLPSKTLGPISDLERHLPEEWWKTLFNAMYIKTDGDVVENDTNTIRDIDLVLQITDAKPDDAILDLCCGQGRHCIELARRGFRHVTGIDRSRYLIRLARKRTKRLGLHIHLSEGDARKVRLAEHSQDSVLLMGNSFGYFEREEDDIALLNSVKRVVKPHGRLVMDIVNGAWMRNNFEPRSWEWIDQSHFVCRERTLSGDGKRIVSREVIVNSEIGVIADQFYAERLYSLEDIEALFEKVGFKNMMSHGTLISDSTRGQDLGMMANRLIISAKAPQAPVSDKPKRILPVTVILGDPELPDSVKKNGQFNPEDMETIRTLKKSLASLKKFKFSYLSHHDTLQETLAEHPPEFVFNLCDEGFKNKASMELHVPALLDMAGVPYTGAEPACLAMCYNKFVVRAVAAALDIPVPLETYYDSADQMASLPSIFPALLKPVFGDSSVGITQRAVVFSAEQLINYLDELKVIVPNTPILIQEFLNGREYSVGLVGNSGNFQVLPVLEVDYGKLPKNLPQILSYESKWDPDSPYWNDIRYKEADLPEEERRKIVDHSIHLFDRLGCRDYARFDFRADAQGTIKLLEVNPNPGWCWDGKLNIMAGFQGLKYDDLLEMILNAAKERIFSKTR